MFPSIIPVLSHVVLDLLELDLGLEETVLAFRQDLDKEFLDVGLSDGDRGATEIEGVVEDRGATEIEGAVKDRGATESEDVVEDRRSIKKIEGRRR